MLYKKFTPSAFLEPFVKTFYIWECSGTQNTPFVFESPPSGYASIVINYGDVYRIANERYSNQTVPRFFLSGQSTKLYQLHRTGTIGMIGVVFKPAAVHSIFGFPMYEFTDERVDLAALLGDQISVVYEQVLNAETSEDKVAVLELFLTRKVIQSKGGVDRTDYIANLILQRNGILPMQDLMTELYVCPRQFQRQFLKKVGVSPKYFGRISRMSSLCAVMARDKWSVQDWHEIIYQHGYYDQSHFIKDFTEIMGKAPSSYARNNVELGNFLK